MKWLTKCFMSSLAPPVNDREKQQERVNGNTTATESIHEKKSNSNFSESFQSTAFHVDFIRISLFYEFSLALVLGSLPFKQNKNDETTERNEKWEIVFKWLRTRHACNCLLHGARWSHHNEVSIVYKIWYSWNGWKRRSAKRTWAPLLTSQWMEIQSPNRQHFTHFFEINFQRITHMA